MDETGAYLRGKYLEEKAEIERVNETLTSVVSVFSDFVKSGTWPYELRDGLAPDLPSSYSYSTNAMIIFALEVLIGQFGPSTLLPGIKRSSLKLDTEGLGKVSESAFLKLQAEVAARQRAGSLTYSGSFGKDDPFTLTWLVELVSHKIPEGNAFRDSVRKEAKKRADEMRDLAVGGKPILEGWPQKDREPLIHSFPLLRLLHLLKLLDAEPKDIESVTDILKKRMHLQLSYASIPNSGFDAAELVFCIDGILLERRDALDRGTLERAFEVIRDSQARNPYWRPLRPFVATSQGFGLLPLSVEIANSLLRICDTLDTPAAGASYFSTNLEVFRQYSQWLLSRVAGGNAGAKPFRGWPSEHVHDPGKIHLWETSQVALFLLHYSALLQRHIGRESLASINIKADKPAPKSWSDWESNEPIKLASAPKFEVYRRVREEFVEARRPGKPPARFVSMLLYGPPGTGKTSAAEALARELDYSFIGISPSDFIARGESEVEARTKLIFDALGEQSETVVLFDEIDRLILDRDSLLYQKQGDIFQFMTPGMLTKIKRLRDLYRIARNSIFIIGTNYADRIDTAIKRRGRIDQLYLVGPPDKAQRRLILTKLLEKANKTVLDDSNLEILVRDTTFATYGELEQMVDEAVDRHRKGADLGECLKQAVPSPSISLASYGSRFRAAWKSKLELFPTNQEPFDEFFLLTHLLAESQRPPAEEELDLIRTICRALANLAPIGNMNPWDSVEPELYKKLIEKLDETFAQYLLPELKKLYNTDQK